MRISFVGGGTDIADFYRYSPGRVISTAIDKYVYVAINRPPLIRDVSARYSASEMVDHPSKLRNDRIREALLDVGISSNIEVGTFTDVFVNAGLGSSSSFSVALMKGLYATLGRRVDRREAAEAACRLEIDLVKEPIGKQDQYAAALGGFNIFQFNPDESVDIAPVRLDYKRRLNLESHLLVFFTGITRLAASVLQGQKEASHSNFETLRDMADSVLEFRDRLLVGDIEGMGRMLHATWLKKTTLGSKISTPAIDAMYEAGMGRGAWGGKVLGAGGGGCMMFLAPRETHDDIRRALRGVARQYSLDNFNEIPVRFVQSGVEILAHSNSADRGNAF